jgi:hypothetical protein
MSQPEGEATLSVSWRLRRVTIEYSYVTVPVTESLMKVDEGGSGRIDVQRMEEQAIKLGSLPAVEWYPEEQRIELHPLQKAPGPGEKALKGTPSDDSGDWCRFFFGKRESDTNNPC